MTRSDGGSRVGDDLVEAFEELADFLRGEVEVESYETAEDVPGQRALSPSQATGT